jgi:hypothetical protein
VDLIFFPAILSNETDKNTVIHRVNALDEAPSTEKRIIGNGQKSQPDSRRV